jgi:exosortase/archaeosortase family protein
MAIKALHAITAYLSRLTVGWKWVLFWCALPISMAANVLRMVSIVLVSAYVDKEFGLKAWHDYSPYLLFLFVFGILFFVGIVMEFATGAHRRDINAKNKEADFTEFTKGNHAE